MEYKPSFRDDLHVDIQPSFMHSFRDEHNAKMMYGLPKVKKFPMPDAKHVRSAIRFFNYAKPSQERELANAILARMADYGIDPNDINVGDNNRFKKYLQHSYLAHHGIKGMHWGVRRYQNPDGSLTNAGRRRYDKTKKALEKADMYDKAADYLNSQIKKDIPSFEKARLMTQATKAQQISKRTRKHLDPSMVKKIQRDREVAEQKKKLEREKEYHNSPFNRGMRFMDDAMHEVFGKNAKPNYMNIYKEMSKDKRFRKLLDSEDNDDYKEAEVAWLKKHGFWDSYLDAVHNGYKDME